MKLIFALVFTVIIAGQIYYMMQVPGIETHTSLQESFERETGEGRFSSAVPDYVVEITELDYNALKERNTRYLIMIFATIFTGFLVVIAAPNQIYRRETQKAALEAQ